MGSVYLIGFTEAQFITELRVGLDNPRRNWHLGLFFLNYSSMMGSAAITAISVNFRPGTVEQPYVGTLWSLGNV